MNSVDAMKIDRYIFICVISLIIGIFYSWPDTVGGFSYIIFIIFLFRKKRIYMFLVIMFFIGGYLYSNSILERTSGKGLLGVSKEIKIIIDEKKGNSFIAKIIDSEDKSFYKKKIFFYYPENLEIGSIYQGRFKIEEFDQQRVPHGFNEKKHYFSKNVYYKGTSQDLYKNEVEKNILSELIKWRVKLMNNYSDKYTEKAKGIVRALVFGDKLYFPEETRDSFQILGISHLLAVSGLHGGIIAGVAYKFFSPGGFYAKNFGAWFFLILYVFLAGFSPSINRAALMFFVYSVGKIYLKYPDPFTIVAISAFIQILFNPFVIFSIGFQLSYATVLGIILFHINKKSKLSLSLAAVVGTVPILVFYFNKISFVGIIINLFYVPLFAVITFFSMAGLFLPFIPIWGHVNNCINFIIEGTEEFSLIFNFTDINISTPAIWEVLLYYILVYFIFYNVKIRKKVLLSLLILLLFMNSYSKKWELTFIDVGQGDSVLVNTEEEKMILIDGGPWGGEVEKFLSSKGINNPELYVVSHGDADHINGILWLMEKKPPKNLLIPVNSESNKLIAELIILSKNNKVNIIYGYAGQEFFIDNTKFEILSPTLSQEYVSSNDHSLVILITKGNKKILLTGDVEKNILDNLPTIKNIDILKAPHHGSNTGNSFKFYNNTNISSSVISCGFNNPYGHPGKQYIDLLKKENISIIRTDLKGTISFIYKGEKDFLVKTILD